MLPHPFDGIDITWNRVAGGVWTAMVNKLVEEYDFKAR
jgi:hypothetical protein